MLIELTSHDISDLTRCRPQLFWLLRLFSLLRCKVSILHALTPGCTGQQFNPTGQQYCTMYLFCLLMISPWSWTDGAGQFSVIPTNVFVNETELATSGCSHPNSTTIIWRRANGTVISNSTEGFSISPITTPQGSTLNIASADVALHNGSYVCVAVLGGGAEETTAFSIIVQCKWSVSNVTAICVASSLPLTSANFLYCTGTQLVSHLVCKVVNRV